MVTASAISTALAHVGAQTDDTIDIADVALILASFDHPATDLEVYRTHLRALSDAVKAAALEAGFDSDTGGPEEMATILSRVIAEDFHYTGDEETYNDLDNANLMRVIERRKGLPVTLGVVYLATARAQGWAAAGLNFPGHFLIRLESRDGRRVIIDPFYSGRVMETHALRDLLKLVHGAGVELDATHYRPVSNREVLVRLQNNVKTRRMELNEVAGALEAVATMQALDPENAGLWRESGVMHMRLGHLKSAVEAFERFVTHAPEGADRQKIAQVIEELRERLH